MDVSCEVLKAGIKNTDFRDVMTSSQVEVFVPRNHLLSSSASVIHQLIFVACTSYSSMWFSS